MKQIIKYLRQFKQWILFVVSVSVESSDVGKCTKCKFNCETDYTTINDCNVGSYYAEKGLNRICYNGELWKETER